MRDVYEEPEFHVTVKLRNNRLIQLRRSAGLTRKALAERIGLSATAYGELENLKRSPYAKRGGKPAGACLTQVLVWSQAAKRVAVYWGEAPEDLFPQALDAVQQTSTERTLRAPEVSRMLAQHEESLRLLPSPEDACVQKEQGEAITRLLDTLTPLEARVLRLRNGFDGKPLTRDEIAAREEVTKERIRLIEAKALRKLRHPSRACVLYQSRPEVAACCRQCAHWRPGRTFIENRCRERQFVGPGGSEECPYATEETKE